MANHVFMYFTWSNGILYGSVVSARPAEGDASNDDFGTFYWILPSTILIVSFPFRTVLDFQFVDPADLYEVGQRL